MIDASRSRRRFPLLAAALAARVDALKVGSGIEPGVQIGPMINERAVQKIERHVHDAIAKGARLLTGGDVEGSRLTKRRNRPLPYYVAAAHRLSTAE